MTWTEVHEPKSQYVDVNVGSAGSQADTEAMSHYTVAVPWQ